jgi:hypothetical protein
MPRFASKVSLRKEPIMKNSTGESRMGSRSATDLLAEGDNACARADASALAEVARSLRACVAAPDPTELDAIATLAGGDLAAAAVRWSRIAEKLRHELLRHRL